MAILEIRRDDDCYVITVSCAKITISKVSIQDSYKEAMNHAIWKIRGKMNNKSFIGSSIVFVMI